MPRGLGIVLYGGEGVGKTSWAAQWSKLGAVKFISIKETGYDDLEMVGDIPTGCSNVNVSKFEELDEETTNCDAETLVIDSLLGVQDAIFEFVCRTRYNGRWDGKDGFTSYWKGQRVDSPPFFYQYLDRLGGLLAKGTNVILLGHVYTITLPNTLGADFLSHVVAMDDGEKGGLRSCLMHWAPNVLFANITIDITRSTETDRAIVLKGKANDRDNRVIYTEKSPGHAAKNRLKLPPVISMGNSAKEAFENFYNKLPKTIQERL